MRNLIFLAFVSFLTLGACENGPKKGSSIVDSPKVVTQDTNPVFVFNYEESSTSCESADSMRCAKVEVNLHLLKGTENKGAIAINEKLKAETTNNIGLFTGDESRFTNIGSAAKAFIADYDQFVSEDDPEYITPWDIGIESDLLDHTDQLYAVALNTYTYTGGAHPNYFTTLFTFNRKDGSEIDPKSRITDKDALLKLVEKDFRKHYQLEEDEKLFEVGFYFENGFTLPENIALKTDGALFIYNPYEVAPYAAGSASVFIPKNQLSGIIDFSGLE